MSKYNNYVINTLASDSQYFINKIYIKKLGIKNTIVLKEMIETYYIWEDNNKLLPDPDNKGEYWFIMDLQELGKYFGLSKTEINKSIDYLIDNNLIYEAHQKPKSKSQRFFQLIYKNINNILTNEVYYE